MAEAVKDNLTSRVRNYWKRRGSVDKDGLVLLDEVIRNFYEHKNWDNLSRFISHAQALNTGDKSKVMGVIRAAFGDQITYKKDPKHATGGRINVKAGMNFADLVLLNNYGHVAKAIENKKGFRDSDLHKTLKGLEPEKKKPELDMEKMADHLVKYMTDKGVTTPGALLALVQQKLKAQVVAKPVTLVEGEPDH